MKTTIIIKSPFYLIISTLSNNSAMINPAAQISTPVPYFFAPKSNSGDRYHLSLVNENDHLSRLDFTW